MVRSVGRGKSGRCGRARDANIVFRSRGRYWLDSPPPSSAHPLWRPPSNPAGRADLEGRRRLTPLSVPVRDCRAAAATARPRPGVAHQPARRRAGRREPGQRRRSRAGPPDRRRRGARPDAGPGPDLQRDLEPVRLRRLQPAGHERRRRAQPLRPDGQRHQGRDLQQDRHAADAARSTSAACGRAGPAPATPATRSCSTTSSPTAGCSASSRRRNHLCFAISKTAEPAGRLPPVHVQRRHVPRLLQGRRVAERLLRLGQRVDLHGLCVRPHEDARRRPDRERSSSSRARPTSCSRPTSTGRRRRPPEAGSSTRSRTTRSTAASTGSSCSGCTPDFTTPANSTFALVKTVPGRAVHLHGLRVLQLQLRPPAGHARSGSTRSASGRCSASPTAASATTRALVGNFTVGGGNGEVGSGDPLVRAPQRTGRRLDPVPGGHPGPGRRPRPLHGQHRDGRAPATSPSATRSRAARCSRASATRPGARRSAGHARSRSRSWTPGSGSQTAPTGGATTARWRSTRPRLPVLVHERVLQPELGVQLEDRRRGVHDARLHVSGARYAAEGLERGTASLGDQRWRAACSSYAAQRERGLDGADQALARRASARLQPRGRGRRDRGRVRMAGRRGPRRRPDTGAVRGPGPCPRPESCRPSAVTRRGELRARRRRRRLGRRGVRLGEVHRGGRLAPRVQTRVRSAGGSLGSIRILSPVLGGVANVHVDVDREGDAVVVWAADMGTFHQVQART